VFAHAHIQHRAGGVVVSTALGEWIGIRAQVDHVVTFPRDVIKSSSG
jgi:hypothetical protein